MQGEIAGVTAISGVVTGGSRSQGRVPLMTVKKKAKNGGTDGKSGKFFHFAPPDT